MNDFVKSGFGAESTDTELKALVTKPIWHLVPLPLSQINPSATKSLSIRGQIPSLRSCCLSVISKNLHTYTIDQFQGIPSILVQRIISRVRNDRVYEDEFEGRQYSTRNPDEATIWSLKALLDPKGTIEKNDNNFQLALPQDSILNYLTPNNLLKYPEHPLVELPKLYHSINSSSNSGISLLTTLTLDGMDGFVNDQNIQSLKYCTYLTVLWMKGCKITDSGLRLLSSSLVLPGEKEEEGTGRGLWRLRSWSLGGCRGVTDRSMKSFARYPGLVLLDIRDTSCTTSAIDIFNRASRELFSEYNPDFQPCTEGLLELFSRNSPSSDILDKLCLTLIKLPPPSSTSPNATDEIDKSHLSLNIIPSHRPIEEKYLPESSGSIPSKTSEKVCESGGSKSVYRNGGVGQIYGSSVSRIHDEVTDFRKRRKNAIYMTEKEHKVEYEAEQYAKMSTTERRNYTRRKNREEKEEKEFRDKFKYKDWGDDHASAEYIKSMIKPKTYKARGKKGENERSKSFVMGNKGEQVLIDRISKDDKNLMLVRMVNDNWENLSWTIQVNAGSTGFINNGNGTASQDSILGFMKKSSNQRLKANNFVEELLGTTMTVVDSTSTAIDTRQISSQASNPFQSQLNPSSTPVRQTTHITSSPIQPASSQSPIQRERNPFKSVSSKSNSMGVRPLSSTHTSSLSKPLSSSQSQSHTPFSQSQSQPQPLSQSKVLNSSPFSRSIESRPSISSELDFAPTTKNAQDDLSFSFSSSNGTKKRTFDGSGSSVDNKRSGMKMFSMGSQRK